MTFPGHRLRQSIRKCSLLRRPVDGAMLAEVHVDWTDIREVTVLTAHAQSWVIEARSQVILSLFYIWCFCYFHSIILWLWLREKVLSWKLHEVPVNDELFLRFIHRLTVTTGVKSLYSEMKDCWIQWICFGFRGLLLCMMAQFHQLTSFKQYAQAAKLGILVMPGSWL